MSIELGAGLISQADAVTGVLPAVAGDLVSSSNAAGGQDHGGCSKQLKTAPFTLVAKGADNPVAIFQESGHRKFHMDLDSLMDSMVLQGADHFQAGPIADVGQARVAVSAKVALQNPA